MAKQSKKNHRGAGSGKKGPQKDKPLAKNRRELGKPSGKSGRPFDAPKGCRWVVGIHSCLEAIHVRGQDVKEIWLKEDWAENHELNGIREEAKAKSIKISEKPQRSLDRLASTSQGVAALVGSAPELELEELGKLEEAELILALDEIVDPHNVGAILRSAWLMGARAVLVPEMRSSQLTPATAKVACGAAEHIPLVVVSNLPRALKDLKDSGFWIYGLAGEEGSKEIWSLDYADKACLVVGAEAKGLRVTTRKSCDELVGIPQIEATASYNASVAAAIAMAEVRRQSLGKVRQD